MSLVQIGKIEVLRIWLTVDAHARAFCCDYNEESVAFELQLPAAIDNVVWCGCLGFHKQPTLPCASSACFHLIKNTHGLVPQCPALSSSLAVPPLPFFGPFLSPPLSWSLPLLVANLASTVSQFPASPRCPARVRLEITFLCLPLRHGHLLTVRSWSARLFVAALFAATSDLAYFSTSSTSTGCRQQTFLISAKIAPFSCQPRRRYLVTNVPEPPFHEEHRVLSPTPAGPRLHFASAQQLKTLFLLHS